MQLHLRHAIASVCGCALLAALKARRPHLKPYGLNGRSPPSRWQPRSCRHYCCCCCCFCCCFAFPTIRTDPMHAWLGCPMLMIGPLRRDVHRHDERRRRTSMAPSCPPRLAGRVLVEEPPLLVFFSRDDGNDTRKGASNAATAAAAAAAAPFHRRKPRKCHRTFLAHH